MFKKNLFRIIIVCLFVVALFAAYVTFMYHWPFAAQTANKHTPKSLSQRETLTIITRSDLHGYYNYEDQPQGFEYELARAFADYAGLKLQIAAGNCWDEMQTALTTRRADIIAGMTVNAPNSKKFALSNSYLSFRQVFVTNKNQPAIKALTDLAGRSITTSVDSVNQASLDELMGRDLGFNAVCFDGKTTNDFIRGVAEGELDATIASDYIAMTYARHYPNINIGMVLKDNLQMAWAVNPDDTELLAKINLFFAQMEADGSLERLYNRYFDVNHDQNYNELESFHRRIKRNLPTYQNSIRQSAYQHEFDWRLIAAMIYQESQFNPNAVSYHGASGLMQLMPKTASSLGLPAANIYDPHKNIAAGVKYLKRMYDLFDEVEEETNRIRLALAAYNAGVGHVLDARKLAEERGLDKNLWENIGPMLKLLMQKEYYSTVKYGYCNGNETSNYVNNVMIYYDILKYRDASFTVDFEFNASPDLAFPNAAPNRPNSLASGVIGRWLAQLR